MHIYAHCVGEVDVASHPVRVDQCHASTHSFNDVLLAEFSEVIERI